MFACQVCLNPKELGGVFLLFDRDSCGYIDAKEFLIAFMQLSEEKDNESTAATTITHNAATAGTSSVTTSPGRSVTVNDGSRVNVPTRWTNFSHYFGEMRKVRIF